MGKSGGKEVSHIEKNSDLSMQVGRHTKTVYTKTNHTVERGGVRETRHTRGAHTEMC